MINKSIRHHSYDIAMLIIIAICLLVSIWYNADLPGLYLDSVNPDYAGVQILSSMDVGYTWTFSTFNNFPVLPQMYHGAVTTITTIISCLITGTTSVLQLHIVNAIYGFVICALVYFMLKRFAKNRAVATVTTILLATSPSLITIFRVQYYIKLPGAAFIIGALYLMLAAGEEERIVKRNQKIAWSGMLSGMAFYSYFHYLFFAPALFALMLYQTRMCSKIERSKSALLWGASYCVGILGYIIGYTNKFFTENIVWLIFFAVLTIAFSLIFTITYGKFKGITAKVWLGILGSVVIFVLVFVIINHRVFIDTLGATASSLNVSGEEMNLFNRILTVFKLWRNILNSHSAENLIFQESFTIFPHIYLTVLVIGTIAAMIIVFLKKARTPAVHMMFVLLTMLGSFCLCAVFFASRLWVQHFVPLLPLSFLLIGTELVIVCDGLRAVNFKVITCVFLILLSINFVNAGIFQYQLGLSGGHGKFTHQINELSYEAMENQRQGMKEVYVFEEWGFFCGFSYLTKNTIPYTSENGVECAPKYLEQDYTVVICSWSEETILEQQQQLNEKYQYTGIVEERCCLDGKIAFYTLTVIPQ